jgi:hypothetical protein
MSIQATIEPYKGRIVELGARVRIHRNLHHSNWSIVAVSGSLKGLVVGHAEQIGVWGPRFIVNEAGRQRVLRDRKKNVHAYIEGSLSLTIPTDNLLTIRHRVAYNPYRADSFMVSPREVGGSIEEPQPIDRGGFAWGDKEGLAWVIGPRNRA